MKHAASPAKPGLTCDNGVSRPDRATPSEPFLEVRLNEGVLTEIGARPMHNCTRHLTPGGA